MVNTLIDVLGRTVSTEQGLQKLTIEHFGDQNSLQVWPLEQLVFRSPHLQYLHISYLGGTTPANRSLLLEFAAQAALRSSCLSTLHIEDTESSAEEGDKFLQAFADHTIHSLHHLTISKETEWFKDRDGCMAPLLVFLARQASLQSLTISKGEFFLDEMLSEAQKELIHEVVTSNAAGC